MLYVPCCVEDCEYRNTKRSRHSFPKNPTLRKLWVQVIREVNGDDNWEPRVTSTVCCHHFEEECFITTPGAKLKRLADWSVPSVFKIRRKLPFRKAKVCPVIAQRPPARRLDIATARRTKAKKYRTELKMDPVATKIKLEPLEQGVISQTSAMHNTLNGTSCFEEVDISECMLFEDVNELETCDPLEINSMDVQELLYDNSEDTLISNEVSHNELLSMKAEPGITCITNISSITAHDFENMPSENLNQGECLLTDFDAVQNKLSYDSSSQNVESTPDTYLDPTVIDISMGMLSEANANVSDESAEGHYSSKLLFVKGEATCFKSSNTSIDINKIATKNSSYLNWDSRDLGTSKVTKKHFIHGEVSRGPSLHSDSIVRVSSFSNVGSQASTTKKLASANLIHEDRTSGSKSLANSKQDGNLSATNKAPILCSTKTKVSMPMPSIVTKLKNDETPTRHAENLADLNKNPVLEQKHTTKPKISRIEDVVDSIDSVARDFAGGKKPPPLKIKKKLSRSKSNVKGSLTKNVKKTAVIKRTSAISKNKYLTSKMSVGRIYDSNFVNYVDEHKHRNSNLDRNEVNCLNSGQKCNIPIFVGGISRDIHDTTVETEFNTKVVQKHTSKEANDQIEVEHKDKNEQIKFVYLPDVSISKISRVSNDTKQSMQPGIELPEVSKVTQNVKELRRPININLSGVAEDKIEILCQGNTIENDVENAEDVNSTLKLLDDVKKSNHVHLKGLNGNLKKSCAVKIRTSADQPLEKSIFEQFIGDKKLKESSVFLDLSQLPNYGQKFLMLFDKDRKVDKIFEITVNNDNTATIEPRLFVPQNLPEKLSTYSNSFKVTAPKQVLNNPPESIKFVKKPQPVIPNSHPSINNCVKEEPCSEQQSATLTCVKEEPSSEQQSATLTSSSEFTSRVTEQSSCKQQPATLNSFPDLRIYVKKQPSHKEQGVTFNLISGPTTSVKEERVCKQQPLPVNPFCGLTIKDEEQPVSMQQSVNQSQRSGLISFAEQSQSGSESQTVQIKKENIVFLSKVKNTGKQMLEVRKDNLRPYKEPMSNDERKREKSVPVSNVGLQMKLISKQSMMKAAANKKTRTKSGESCEIEKTEVSHGASNPVVLQSSSNNKKVLVKLEEICTKPETGDVKYAHKIRPPRKQKMETKKLHTVDCDFFISCEACGRIYNENRYHSHLETKKSLACKFCGDKFVSLCEIQNHFVRHAQNGDLNYCVLTADDFLTPASAFQCISLFHPVLLGYFRCLCTRVFNCRDSIQHHLIYSYSSCKHTGKITRSYNKGFAYVKKPRLNKNNRPRKVYNIQLDARRTPYGHKHLKCRTCFLEFYNRYDYLEHVRFAHPIPTFCCDFCGAEFLGNKHNFESHIFRHLNDTLMAQINCKDGHKI